MIFIDSSYLIALVNDNDQWYNRAVKIIEKIENRQCVISTLHISETITMIGKISDGKVADGIYGYIRDNYTVKDATIDLLDDSRNEYLKYNGTMSLTDVVAIEIMKKHKIKKIVSFNTDFDKIKGIIRIHR